MKIFILGLDGATHRVLDVLREEGLVPNIQELVEKGSSGNLRSIFPPVTAPAWLALATGLNPGKTGVFDYINKIKPESHELAAVSSKYYDGKAVWDYLNQKGHKVGIFNYPTLSPPPAVNGFAVSGIGGKRGNLCSPRDLEKELDEIAKGYEYSLNLRNPKYRGNISLFLDDINRIVVKQGSTLKHLVSAKEWDFFFAVFSFTDWMQHVLWKDIDETHPLYDPRTSSNIKRRFKDTWKRIDGLIGEVQGLLPSDTNLMVVSDHGMGPLKGVFHPNTWLKEKGWLKRKDLGWREILVDKVRLFAEGSDSKYYSALLHVLKLKVLKIRGTVDLIDIEQSMAFSPEHNTMFGCINLTEKGKSMNGFKTQVIEELRALPKSFAEIQKVDILLPEEIYSGPYVNLAPDIFFVINDYESTVEIDFSKPAFLGSPSLKLRTGGHAQNGIFIAKGDVFRKAKLDTVSILDVAPTVLALFETEISSQMDGKVIGTCLRPEILESLSVKIRKEEVDEKENVLSAGELEEMRGVLRSLGYM